MSTFRFDLNEEYSKRLEKMAEEAKMNIQDFIRYKLFGEKTIFTVEEAIRRIQTGDFDGKEFTLPDVFGEEWTLEKGPSGTLPIYHSPPRAGNPPCSRPPDQPSDRLHLSQDRSENHVLTARKAAAGLNPAAAFARLFDFLIRSI